MGDETEAARDPKVGSSQPIYSQYDFDDHRACTLYVGYYTPGHRRKSHHRRRHHVHQKQEYANCVESNHDISKPVTPPSERVHFILGEDEDGSHEPHPLFSEMEELFYRGEEVEWRETARWIKFEEDVEEGGNRWSKPHVATVTLHSFVELRSCISNGTILLDMDAHDLDEIADLIIENMEASQQIYGEIKGKIKETLLRPHRHQHELRDEWSEKGSRVPLIRSLTDVRRNSIKNSTTNPISFCSTFTPHILSVVEESAISPDTSASAGALSENISHNFSSWSFRAISTKNCTSPDDALDSSLHRINQSFMRKIPPKAEASNILVGEVDYLDKVVSSFIRLSTSCHLGDLTEVPVPTRFIFILLGPVGHSIKYHEIGRAMATLLSDEVFHGVAYKGKNRDDLLAGVDEFLDATTVLPPGVWDPSTRIEPPTKNASQDVRKGFEPRRESNVRRELPPTAETTDSDCEDFKCDSRLFSGLIADIRRKAPWYLSDFKDSIALQCISSIVFLYFACIAQITTFGGLLAHFTKQRMASVECLFSALLCGVTYSLFSGQPLTLLGITGPVLAFESIVFDICEQYSIDYLSMRVWIGIWTSTYLLIFVAFNLASLVRYITRFTEEILALLVSVYFIYKAVKNVLQIAVQFPFRMGSSPFYPLCVCLSPRPDLSIKNESQCQSLNGISAPDGCSYTPPIYVPHIFLMSVILFISTFVLILLLREVKRTPFFPTKIRIFISDFSVVISVVAMTVLDHHIGLGTPKLEVPQAFKPSWSNRDWLVPFFGENTWWSALIAIVPALLLTMLIFMDQSITSVIVNRKENKLKKGHGYHLDLFVLAFLIAICSIFGLPWFVAATILSITHVNSLKKATQCSAPGDKPQFLGVREQRITHFCVFVLIGLSVFFTSVLKFIPMPILYGVFLFMGVKSLKGLQFFERILLMFMPEKYQPDYSYLRYIPIRHVRWYTLLQLFLTCLLFACKLFKPTAFVFPILLLGVIWIRNLLGYVFNKAHLKMLDDVVPEITDFKKSSSGVDTIVPNLSEVVCLQGAESKATMKSNHNSHANINISEVLMQSSIWKCIDQQSQKTSKKIQAVKNKKRKQRIKRDSSKSEDCKRLSVMEEDEGEYTNSAPESPLTSKSPQQRNSTDV